MFMPVHYTSTNLCEIMSDYVSKVKVRIVLPTATEEAFPTERTANWLDKAADKVCLLTH
jgi:hypothetical protein